MKVVLVVIAAAAVFAGVLFFGGFFSKTELTSEETTQRSQDINAPARVPELAQGAANESPDKNIHSASQIAHSAAPTEQTAAMPPEAFDKLITGPSGVVTPLQAVNEKFQKELKDLSWSANVEPQIQAHMSQDELLKDTEIASIDCRKTVCEVRAYSRSVASNQASTRAFQLRLIDVVSSDWAKGYGLQMPVASISTASDGRAVMIGYVAKNKP